ncbi:hypothetical protein D0T60_04550 [Bacteroides sp. 224]|nr:murein L,D-transpeptidase catalytic domain family protein [Bacteroides sp. 224]NDV64511.1 hypothetical protein [Bacteroides sp. 224]
MLQKLNADSDIERLYYEMNLNKTINYSAFEQAMKGYYQIKKKKKEILTLIDFSKPSTEERLFVLDIKAQKLLHSSLVSHGKNSGGLYATSFSNRNGSFQSSLGFYLTENTYTGKNGYSLILEGLEKGINDKAKERAIVVHGAPYSNPSVIASSGRLGRSLGCPALPENVSREIINTIKGGSLLFIYAKDKKYLSQSPIFRNRKPVA